MLRQIRKMTKAKNKKLKKLRQTKSCPLVINDNSKSQCLKFQGGQLLGIWAFDLTMALKNEVSTDSTSP